MAKKKVHHEEHVDESWLIPYADMLTLLLALFIVMFAMGQTDKAKFDSFKDQFNVLFSGGSGTLNGSTMVPIELPDGVGSEVILEEDRMKKIKENLEAEIEREGYSDQMKIVLSNEGLEISIQDALLFASGEAVVLDQISPLLMHISKLLNNLDNHIRVVGHTDNVPINNAKFRSNWDLSAMRAINVMLFLTDRGGLNAKKFLVQGNGEYMPKYDNATAEGRAKNRRVEIFIVRNHPLNEDNNTN